MIKINKIAASVLSISLATTVFASDSNKEDLRKFIASSLKPGMVLEKFEIEKSAFLDKNDKNDNWKIFYVKMKFNAQKKPIKDVFFYNGKYLTQGIIRIADKKDMRVAFAEKNFKSFPEYMYSDGTLLIGNGKNKNKAALISDPFCPFCIPLVSDIVQKVKNIDVYYFSFPLERIHPLSFYLSGILNAKGTDAIKKWYLYANGHREEINNLVNNKDGLNKLLVSLFGKEILSIKIKKNKLKKIEEKISSLGINGTPALFIDGKIDMTRQKIFKIK